MPSKKAVSVECLLEALSHLPVACPRIYLGTSLRADWEAVDSVLEAAEADGLISAWDEAPGALSIVLTPLAAERLQIEIDDSGKNWQPKGTPPEPVRRLPSYEQAESDLLRDPEDLRVTKITADPQAHEPVLEAIAIEIAERLAACLKPAKTERQFTGVWRYFDSSLGRVPYSRILLGLDLTWPVYWPEGEPCPCCRGRGLETSEYCLVCECSGVDHLLPPVAANQFPKANDATANTSRTLPIACKDDPGYVERNGVKVPERYARLMKG